jgi:hypothetical protein
MKMYQEETNQLLLNMCLPNTRQNGNNCLVVKTGHGRQCREEEKPKFPRYFLRTGCIEKYLDLPGDWTKLHSEELNYLYSSQKLARVIKSRRVE